MMTQTVAYAAAGRHSAVVGATQEYLTLTLGAEDYGADVLKAQAIRGYEKPIAIANAPAYIKGVVNPR